MGARRAFIKIIQGLHIQACDATIAATKREAASSGQLTIGLLHHPDLLRIRSKGRVQSQISSVEESSFSFRWITVFRIWICRKQLDFRMRWLRGQKKNSISLRG